VYIRYLRSKLDVKGQKSYIKTVRGVGYNHEKNRKQLQFCNCFFEGCSIY
ncbi:hypothetical protein GR255_23275, partial [Mycobacterium tuberculosis]|nr:hypothetical protein [Mycobacterium tuberculosis]